MPQLKKAIEYLPKKALGALMLEVDHTIVNDFAKHIESSIAEAQRDAIKAAAEVAKVETHYLEKSQIDVCLHRVDKDSILSLLNDIK